MFKDAKAFGGLSVNDLAAARELYGQTLGAELEGSGPGMVLESQRFTPRTRGTRRSCDRSAQRRRGSFRGSLDGCPMLTRR